MANPIKQLALLREFRPGMDITEYLNTEHRQNLKAIFAAFRSLGAAGSAEQEAVDSGIPYSLYAVKSGSFPSVSPAIQDITTWDTPEEEIGTAGSFDPATGIFTANRDATFNFYGRCAIVANSGAEIYIEWQLNDGSGWRVMSKASNGSLAERGPVASFGKRLLSGHQVKMRVYSIGTQNMTGNASNPVFFNVVQSGIS